MIVGIDGNEANVSERVGSNLYAYNILQSLYQNNSNNRFTIYLKSPPLPDLPEANGRWQYCVLKPGKLWTQWRLPLSLYTHFPRPDIFYTPGHYAPRFSPINTVVTVLDLAFIKYPALFLKYQRGTAQLKSWTEYSVKKAAYVFTISQHTQTDVIQTYVIPSEKVGIAYPGIDETLFKPQNETAIKAVRRHYHLSNPYILHVGTLQPRKNLDRLIQAYEAIPKKGQRLEMVLVGAKGWLMDEFLEKIKLSPKKDHIKLLGFVDSKDLPALYAGSVCTVSVGLEEGFGLPPAEALACGATVVAAKTGALTEVVGGAGIMVDPYSVTSIRHGIMTAVNQTQKTQKKRQELGLNQVVKFNWAKTAKIIEAKLYELTLQR